MPKSKRSGAGRPARNFDPRYASASKRNSRPGSKSPKHRGHRPDEAEAHRSHGDERGGTSGARKQRWDSAARRERAQGGDRSNSVEYERGGDRRHAHGGFGRDDRRERFDDADRGGRRAYGDHFDRGGRNDRSDRNGRSDRGSQFGRRDQGERYERSDRFDRGGRGERFGRSDRPERGDRAERGSRFGRFDRNERFDRSDRGDRAGRFDDSDRPTSNHRAERYGRDDYRDRPARFERKDRSDRPGRFDREPRRSHERRFDGAKRHDFRPERSHGRYADRDAQAVAPRHFDEDQVLQRLQANVVSESDVAHVTFAELGLGNNIVDALEKLGAASPFAIQVATIPDVIAGRNLLGRARTGSGKTIAFGAPLVERLLQLWMSQGKSAVKREPGRAPRALILAPTRELALQIDRTVQPIARSVGLFTTQIYGGVPQARQVGALQRGVDIVIGTPGRIEDLVAQGRLDLSNVQVTVIDEADHMCELGFVEPVQRILRLTDPAGQRLLFSATLDTQVAALIDEFLEDPAVHEIAGEDEAAASIEHLVLTINHREKLDVVRALADHDGKTLVFTRTRAYAEQLAEALEDADIPAVSLHGDLNQSKRTRNLAKLTSGRVNVLVATDVAARGIHIDNVDLVVQADAPEEYKTYLHRSGRTGRAGEAGTVVTLVTKQRRRRTQDLLKRAGVEAEFIELDSLDQLPVLLERAAQFARDAVAAN